MKNYSILAVLILLSSCGPKMQEKLRPAVTAPDGNPNQELTPMSFADENFVKDNRIESGSSFDKLRKTELFLDLANFESNSIWSAKSLNAWTEQEKKPNFKKISYSRSAYLDLVYDHIQNEVNSAVKDADKKISADTQKAVAMIRKEQQQNLQLDPDSTLQEKLKKVQDFLNSLLTDIKKMDLLAEFKTAFTTELKKQSQKLLADAVTLDENLVRAKTLSEALTLIKAYIEKAEIQLKADDQENLKKGLQLALTLDHVTDAPTGLQVIAQVWSLLSEQQQTEFFQTASPELYKFLHGKSKDDIQCMIDKNCRGLKNKLIFNIGVYPAIEKFGLQNMVDLINQKGKAFLDKKVNQVAFESLQSIGETITEQILNTVSEKKSDLGQFKDNLRSHLGEGLDQALTHLKVKTPQILLTDTDASLLDFDSQTTYLREKLKILPQITDQSKSMQLQMEIIEGLLNLQLYSRTPGEKSKVIQSDLAGLITQPQPRQYFNSTVDPSSEANLKQQSELLSTAALALNQLADWKISSFDEGLSQINASEILTQFKNQNLNRSFFPKKDLVALTLSLAAQVLKQLQSPFSPIVLVSNLNEILPVQAIDDAKAPIALAAATGFLKGKRKLIVNASELAEFLSALSLFYQSLEGIEKTRSPFLTSPNAQGQSLLDELLAARHTLKLLIVATSNFISNQLIQQNGLISTEITLNKSLTPSKNYELLDQTRSIEALIQAYEITKIDVYLWTTKRIFQSMNQILYSEKMKFYQQNTANEIQSGVETTQLFETYKNLRKLKKYLTVPQQDQFEKLYAAWLKD
jgi:hypothetical protein